MTTRVIDRMNDGQIGLIVLIVILLVIIMIMDKECGGKK